MVAMPTATTYKGVITGIALAVVTALPTLAAPPASALNQRLTDALGVKSWPVAIQPYSQVKLITYDCEQCRVGGFLFLDGQSQLVTFRDEFEILNYKIEHDLAIKAQHSQVLLTRGGETFQRVERTPDGGLRFLFYQLGGEGEACEPCTAVQFAFDFDARGKYLRPRYLGYVSAKAAFQGRHPPMQQ